MAAISRTLGQARRRLPSSLTFIGKAGTDGYLASIAAAVAGRPATGPVRAPGRIEIAVVGAHLSGLPLNHELVGLGGVFLRATATTSDYSLYALPNTTPPKPGLLRTGAGAAIAVEVWALDAAGFGEFVSRIPAPLGIGTLSLDDGTAVKGFLVEAEAVKGAEDISTYGGWRAYLKR
jgi:allophanate hydrolase